ncbi:MAG: class I SAM-dependent methyltransferase [Nocardioides sp.]
MTVTTSPEDTALKARHRAMWALGDYPAVATDVIAELGEVLVDAVGVTAGERVVDIGAGSGNAALPAARRGANVVATDLTPELLEAGRAAAAAEGVSLRWRTGDAEAMPCDDGEHDVAISCVGIMFAPHHQRAADELVRVVRRDGRIGLLSWTPTGFIGQLFATMKPYAPAPPPGASPAPLWGDLDHVRALLGDRVADLTARQQVLRVDRFADGAAFRDFFKAKYGPTIAVYRSLADDPVRTAALDADLAGLGDRFDLGGGVMEWEYLLVTASRA